MTSLPYGRTAMRPRWEDLPDVVREFVEERLGRSVVGASSQDSGFTGGFASRLRLAGGGQAFVKAAPASNAAIHDSYRQEALIAGALPIGLPATRLLWWDERANWIVLCFDDVEGRTLRRPWDPVDLDATLAMLTDLAPAMTPPPPGLPAFATVAALDDEFSFWRGLAGGRQDPAVMPAAWVSRLPELVGLESDWALLAAGDTATHFDVRSDNVMITADGQVLLCDWNWLTLGAPWLDLISLLIEVHGDGLDAEGVVATHPLSRDVDPRAIDCMLAAWAGYFVGHCALPPPLDAPWVRPLQSQNATATLDWLDARLRSR